LVIEVGSFKEARELVEEEFIRSGYSTREFSIQPLPPMVYKIKVSDKIANEIFLCFVGMGGTMEIFPESAKEKLVKSI